MQALSLIHILDNSVGADELESFYKRIGYGNGFIGNDTMYYWLSLIHICLAVFIPFRVQEIYHENGVYYGPVSYTHLDVYKRQE